MHKLISIIVWISSLLLCGMSYGSEGGVFVSDSRCRVFEVIQIHSPHEFTCRVDRWKGIDNLRLRVRIRNLSVPEGAAARELAMRWISSHLGNSRNIMLQNIEPRNYFRIVADVQIDRIDLVETMRNEGLIRPQESGSEESALREDRLVSLSFPDRLSAKDSETPLIKPQSKPFYSKDSLEKVLSAEVDLSGLDSDMPLREALEVIRLSVAPPLPMVIIWPDLQQNLVLDPETPIGIGGLTKIPLKLAIELILSTVSPGTERPVVLQEGNLLLIVSSRFAAGRMKTGVYEISELAGIPVYVDEFGGGAGRSSSSSYSGGSGR